MGDATTRRRTYDQACPVALALDVVGERWTLLVLRDLFFGPLRFTDLRQGLPGLAPNLLSERLRSLQDAGLVRRVEREAPRRTVYELTPRGRELGPVVHELARFGAGLAEEGSAPPHRLLRGALLALMAPERLDAEGWSARIDLDGDLVDLEVAPAEAAPGARPLARLRVRWAVDAEGPEPEVVVTSSLATLQALRRGDLSVAAARRRGDLRTEGPAADVARLATLLAWT